MHEEWLGWTGKKRDKMYACSTNYFDIPLSFQWKPAAWGRTHSASYSRADEIILTTTDQSTQTFLWTPADCTIL